MITAERKPLDEILELVGDKKKILVAGCDTCVAICLTGGEKEAEILASELRIMAENDGREVEVEHTAAIRQCEWEYLDMIAEKVEAAEVATEFTQRIKELGPNPVKREGVSPHAAAREALGGVALPDE